MPTDKRWKDDKTIENSLTDSPSSSISTPSGKKVKSRHLLVACCLALVALFCIFYNTAPKQFAVTYADTITPAVINEGMEPWYMGNISFNLPQSTTVAEMQISLLYETGDLTEEILLSESMSSSEKSGNGVFFYSMYYPFQVKAHSRKSNETDLLYRLQTGSYVGLLPLENPELFQNPYAEIFVYSTTPDSPQWKTTEVTFYGYIYLTSGKLHFMYSPQMDFSLGPKLSSDDLDYIQEKKDFFINQINNFLENYTWTGDNAPTQPRQLSTMFGYINDGPEALWSEIKFKSIIGTKVRPSAWNKQIYFNFVKSFDLNLIINNKTNVMDATATLPDTTPNVSIDFTKEDIHYIFQQRYSKVFLSSSGQTKVEPNFQARTDNLKDAEYVFGLFSATWLAIKQMGQ